MLLLKILFVVLIFNTALLFAANENYPSTAKSEATYSIGIDFGLRKDKLFWNKGHANITYLGNSYSPNILSELTWDNLETYYTRLKLNGDHGPYRLKAYYGFGYSHNGDNQDSDYLYDNRQGEFSRSNNNGEGSFMNDWSIGLGYKYAPLDQLETVLLFGYALQKQKLKTTDGYQTIPASGAFNDLDSYYEAKWKGWWIGIDLDTKITPRWNLIGSYERHYVDYDAEANWNLRTDLNGKSFEHDSNGVGNVFRLETRYAFYDNFMVTLSYDFSKFIADSGKDTVNFANGTSSNTTFNEAEWESSNLALGVSYHF